MGGSNIKEGLRDKMGKGEALLAAQLLAFKEMSKSLIALKLKIDKQGEELKEIKALIKTFTDN